MMKRIVATLFFLSLVLVALAVIAPSFIDWSQHKDRILAQLKPYLGRNIDVAGQVSFRIVPNPRILLENVTLANAEGAKGDSFMKLKQLEASLKLQPLLQGKFEVEALNLDQPELDLEVLDDGSNNWTGLLKERENGSAGIGDAADTIQFNQITMTKGTLHYLNQVTGASWQVDKLNLAVSADTLFGPYKISGDMQYKGAQVAVTASTGKFGGASVPVQVAFNPSESLPQVKFDGTMDSQGGLNAQGNLDILQGSVASLFDSDFLKHVAFLNEDADLQATLDVKGGDIKINDIKAKYGKKGELTGTVAIALEKGKKPVVAADLSGTALKVTSKPYFFSVPDGFDARLKLKGKNIVWDGVFIPAVALTTDTDKEEWVVKNGRFDLPGKSVVKIAGVATPKTKYGAYTVQVSTEDLPAMLKSLPLGEGNLLKLVEDSQLVKALEWSSSVDLRPENASFSDIDAVIGGKIKMSGVMDVGLDEKAPAFKVNANLDETDMSVFAGDAWSKFAGDLLKAEGTVEVAAKNVSNGDLKLSALSLNAKTGGAVAHLKDMSGTFADGGEFALNGDIAGLNPAKGMDIVYRVKTANPGVVAKALGISLPPPMQAGADVDLHGHIGGDAAKYTFNAEGHGLNISGTQEADANGAATYHETIHLDRVDNGVLAMIGPPVDRLFGSPKGLDGELQGTRANYKITKLDAGSISGWIERKDDKFSGDLSAGTIDFDEWLNGPWNIKEPVSLKLKGKKLAWRGDEVASPELRLEAGPDSLRVSGLSGQLWGGDLTALAEGHKKGDEWNGTLKGGLNGADLGKLAALMDFKGFTVGNGNLDFDLKSDGAKAKEQWFHGVDGALNVKANDLTVKAFAPDALNELLTALKQPFDDLTQDVMKALLSGDTKYSDVQAALTVGDGKINIEKLQLADDSAKVDLKGAYDLGPETYHLSGDIRMKSPADIPSIGLSRAGDMKNAPDYSVNIRALQDYLAKRVAKDDTKPVVAPAPQAETPPSDQELQPNAQAAPDAEHRVLLNHQGEGDQPQPEGDQPAPANPPDGQPIHLTPPSGQTPATAPDAQQTQGPPQPQTPTLPTPAEDGGNGGRVDEPIETEPLVEPQAPLPPPPPVQLVPQPDQSAAPPPAPAPAPATDKAGSPIKGILDRLNDGSETPAQEKPAPAEDEPVKQP